jgi:butyrate kinase
LMDDISSRIRWIAPILVYPGEDELLAMAQGGLRVLHGEEQARDFVL